MELSVNGFFNNITYVNNLTNIFTVCCYLLILGLIDTKYMSPI